MTDPAIIEAAARALYRILYPYSTSFVEEHFAWYHKAKVNDLALAEQSNVAKTFRDVRDILTAITPLILEQAAKVAEEYDGRGIDEDYAALTCEEIAARIRALKEQP